MISSLLDWLADTMIWSGLLIAFVLLVRRPVGRHFGPGIAYALWFLPLARLLLPPVTLPGALAPAAAPLPAALASAAADPIVAPMLIDPAAAQTVAVEAGMSAVLPILLTLWAAGAIAFITLRAVTYHRMRRTLLAQARPVGEVGRVRLVETPALHGPVAFGVFDKIVALPPGFMAQADRQARDFAIAHELSHHRAHDLLANMAAQLVLALHWCNPLAWYGWRAMRVDQEAACDARVMAGRGRADRACYAALIVGIATGQRTAPPPRHADRPCVPDGRAGPGRGFDRAALAQPDAGGDIAPATDCRPHAGGRGHAGAAADCIHHLRCGAGQCCSASAARAGRRGAACAARPRAVHRSECSA